MKHLLRLLPLLACVLAPLSASTDPELAAAARADDARVAATIAADRGRLGSIFSDDLVYTHSSGHVDNKASYLESITSGRLRYLSIEYERRTFTSAAPGIALMAGRCHIKSSEKGKPADNYLAFLAVWRIEDGAWRFLAWQSCHLPPEKS